MVALNPAVLNPADLNTAELNPAVMDAEELLAHFAAKTLTPLQALQSVLERIARQNPDINAFAILNPVALQDARESTARWQAGMPKGALDGVPVTVKDLIDMAGLPTRRGSNLTDPAPARTDAPVVKALRDAGAVIIGKTTTTEFGWKSPGDCPHTGITRNPWHLDHTPGGSSSGAGAAAASGFGALHVGTDAGGSIRIPAAWCGVVGLKPTFGRVPQWPLGAFGNVAVAGPITRSVRDAALMLNVLARFDASDPFSLPDDGRDWRHGIEDGVAGLRIGILQNPGFAAPVDADGMAAMERSHNILQDAGASVMIAESKLPDTSKIFTKIWGAALARLVGSFPVAEQQYLDPGLLEVAMQFADVSAVEMIEAEALRLAAAHEMARLSDEFDAFICPTVPACAPLADAKLSNPVEALWRDWAPWTFLFNLTRQPAISIPVGVNGQNLPCAVQIAAPLYRDDIVLRVARTIERVM
ncbi:MAG: amidase [Acidocella sp. 20-57-95]|nr:MAG: amidase [Acidocella sp. 20-57-95]OYV58894.1 MAG: amidase [Acidocella sp. 21-58-7]HQT63386.1 amidase family protein [Acidocella sp.]